MSNDLRDHWFQLGVGFAVGTKNEPYIDLEKTIVSTLSEGRQDSRLLFGMRGWLLKHHDLVHVSRLIRLIKTGGQTAVLGALVDSILIEVPRTKMTSVLKYCQKCPKPEVLFSQVAASKIDTSLNKEENLDVWKKWNLVSREMDSLRGAIADREQVLNRNPHLVFRALFGAGVRSEVLGYFLRQPVGHALHISQSIGVSYQPVHDELKSICLLGFVDEIREGVSRLFKIRPRVISRLLNCVF